MPTLLNEHYMHATAVKTQAPTREQANETIPEETWTMAQNDE